MSATSIDLSQIKTDALSAASTFRTLIGLGTSDTPTFKAATLSAGTLNGTVLDIAQTWGGTGTYTGIKYNVTDSGPSNAASLLMDLQMGGTSKFKVDKSGKTTVANVVIPQISSNWSFVSFASTDGVTGRASIIYNPGANVIGLRADSFGSDVSLYLRNQDGSLNFRDGSVYNSNPKLTILKTGTTYLYNKNTSDTDYERGVLDWQTTSDVFRIGTEAGGSGTVRNIALVGGNVGIGTTSPGQKLEVNGRIFANTTSGQPALLIQGPAASYPGVYARLNTDSANTSRIGFEVGDSDSPWIFFGPGSAGPYDTSISRPSAGKVYIGTRYQNSYDGTLIAGNVGIGLTSPAAKLDILDTTGAGSGSLQASALNIAQTWSTTGTPTAFKLNVTEVQSNAASLLMDLQVGGSSKLKATKQGYVTARSFATSTGSDLDYNRAGLQLAGYTVNAGVWFGPGAAAAIITETDANTLALRNSIYGQTFRIYNTTDAGLTNYERAKIAWESNVLVIGTEAGGTGTTRDLSIRPSTGVFTIKGRNAAGGVLKISDDPTYGIYTISTESGSASDMYFKAYSLFTFTTGSNNTGLYVSGGSTTLPSGKYLIFGDYLNSADLGGAQYVCWNGVQSVSPALQLGKLDAAAPVAQTLQVQSVSAGTSNTSGVNFKIKGSSGTGTGAGGSIILQTAPAGSSGTAKNSFIDSMVVQSSGIVSFGGTTSSFPAIKRNSAALNFRLADDSADCDITAKAATFSDNVTVSAVNLVTDTTTGTKIGTATTQKLGFYNATPVVQPAAVADATDAASVITQLNLLLARMRDLGLIAT